MNWWQSEVYTNYDVNCTLIPFSSIPNCGINSIARPRFIGGSRPVMSFDKDPVRIKINRKNIMILIQLIINLHS